jgi:hypothetical protein
VFEGIVYVCDSSIKALLVQTVTVAVAMLHCV